MIPKDHRGRGTEHSSWVTIPKAFPVASTSRSTALSADRPRYATKRPATSTSAGRNSASTSTQRRARKARAALDLPVLEDANSIQVALMQVMRLLVSAQIDHKTASLLLYALQTASSNLRKDQLRTVSENRGSDRSPRRTRYSARPATLAPLRNSKTKKKRETKPPNSRTPATR